MRQAIQFPDDLQAMPVFIVKLGSPVDHFFRRNAGNNTRPGAIIPVSDEEFQSFKEDVLTFEIPEKPA